MQITISPQELVLLTKWSGFHGKTPSELASNIIGKRLEDAREVILDLGELGDDLLAVYQQWQEDEDQEEKD